MSQEAESIEIRAMRGEDIARVVELAADLEQAPHWPVRVYEAMLEKSSPRRIALVAEGIDGRKVIGAVVASLTPPEAELETIAVIRGFQRSGVGKRLLGRLEDELRGEDVDSLILEVRGSNTAAIAFYGSQGFLEIGRRRAYYAEPIEDALILRKGLGRREVD